MLLFVNLHQTIDNNGLRKGNYSVKTTILLLLVLLIYSGSAFTAQPRLEVGTKSVGFAIFPDDRNFEIGGNYFIARDFALVTSLGISRDQNETNTSSGTLTTKVQSYTLSGGARKYLLIGDLCVFGEGLLAFMYGQTKYESTVASSNSTADLRGARLSAFAGVEYFFTQQVSVSGKLGVNVYYQRLKNNTSGNSSDSNSKNTHFGTSNGALLLNYYW